jgi:hypothetical protein
MSSLRPVAVFDFSVKALFGHGSRQSWPTGALTSASQPWEAGLNVVVEPVATPGVDGPPPQAATAMPTARTPPAITAARRNRRGDLNPSALFCGV